MQRLDAAPRDGLTVDQVTELLTAETLTVQPGLSLLSADLSAGEDISDDLISGVVSRDMLAAVHGTCQITLSRSLNWGVDLVQPYVTLTDGRYTARFLLGVFALTTPDNLIHDTPRPYVVSGFDRLYLLNRPVGDSYTVVAGTLVLQAVRDVITAAGLSGVLLDSTADPATVPTDRTWPLIPATRSGQTTWLNIVNDLLTSVGYRNLYADETGNFRSGPFTDPVKQSPEFIFDADSSRTIVAMTRHQKYDVWSAPNAWVFIQQNRDPSLAAPTDGDGIYRYTNTSDGPTSVTARGLTWTKVVQVDAADQPNLEALAQVTIAADRRITELLSIDTGIFPAAGHADVFAYYDSALGAQRKVQALQWRLDLLGANTQWQWEVVP